MKRSHLDKDNELLFPDNLGPISGTNVLDNINNTNFNNNVETISGQSAKNNYKNKLLIKSNKFNDTTITAISGAIAGLLSGIVVCPLDVTKTRLQAQGLQNINGIPYYKGILGTMRTIIKDETIAGLYKGLIPTLLGYFPTWTVYFSVYEFSKKLYYNSFLSNEFVLHSCAAITAGSVSTIVTNPIWVVKTRLMLQSNRSSYSTHYHSTFDAFKTIWKQEGLNAFYTGLIPSLLGLSHVAIHFPVYEYLKIRLNCYHNHNSQKYINLPNLIAASSLSKMTASALTYPHEILRTRMQLKSDLPASIQHKILPLIIKTFESEGFRGFYSGFTANLVRTVPASAITLVSFEYMRNHLCSN